MQRFSDRYRLKDKHPLFYTLLLCKSVIMVVLVFFLWFGDPIKVIAYTHVAVQNHEISNLKFWALLFIANAVMYLYGAFYDVRWGRRGLVMGSLLGGFWAFGFWSAFQAGLVDGVSAPLMWTLYTMNCVALSREPAMNPISFAAHNMVAENDRELN